MDERVRTKDDFGPVLILKEHIILPLIIIGVFHVIALMTFIVQVGWYKWCKYGEAHLLLIDTTHQIFQPPTKLLN